MRDRSELSLGKTMRDRSELSLGKTMRDRSELSLGETSLAMLPVLSLGKPAIIFIEALTFAISTTRVLACSFAEFSLGKEVAHVACIVLPSTTSLGTSAWGHQTLLSLGKDLRVLGLCVGCLDLDG